MTIKRWALLLLAASSFVFGGCGKTDDPASTSGNFTFYGAGS